MKTLFTGKVRRENQEEWRGGVRVGKWVHYFENGQFRYKGSYKNGLREGEWVDYRKDGTVNSGRSGIFKNGKKVSD
jgi:antitoxin component YwqK of YwqJK toxin-antitoxin module